MAINLFSLFSLMNEPTITEMVTIFAYRDSWIDDEDYVDWRCGNQLIPSRSFIIGLIDPKNGMGMANIPFTSDTQKHQLNEIIEMLMVRVGVDPTEAWAAAQALIEEGHIRFAKKGVPIQRIEEKVFELRD